MDKLAIPFELRIFLVVILVGVVSVLVILDTSPQDSLVTSRVVQGLQHPVEPMNTLVISGIDIGQAIGFKSPTITGNEFACLSDRRITTDRGRATAKYSLSLYDTINGGCVVTFAETENQKTGVYMKCPSNNKAYDLTILFEPSLDSDIDDNELEDLLQETIPILGVGYTIVKADLRGDTIKMRLLGATGSMDIQDDYTDNEYSTDFKINGRRILEGMVRVKGFNAGDEFRIQSIEYRLYPLPTKGKDVYVGDHQGTKQHLRTPEGFLGDFDLLFKGVGNTQTIPAIVTQPAVRYSGNVIAFDATGDDTYNLIFTNNQGRRYKFPVISVESGSLAFGDGDQDFVFSAGDIDLRDMFAVTSRETRNGVTNILEYSSVDMNNGRAYFKDLSGGEKIGHFDTSTGVGTATIGGTEYDFLVDTSSPHSITIDHDNSGSIGGEAEIVTQGGPRIDFAGGGSGRLEIDSNLFADSSSGETINFAFLKEGSDIDVDVTSGVSLIKNDVTGKREGLSQFGVFVQRDNRNSGNDLVFNMPVSGGQRSVSASVGGPTYTGPSGQAQGEVLVTCERSEFVKRARAARR